MRLTRARLERMLPGDTREPPTPDEQVDMVEEIFRLQSALTPMAHDDLEEADRVAEEWFNLKLDAFRNCTWIELLAHAALSAGICDTSKEGCGRPYLPNRTQWCPVCLQLFCPDCWAKPEIHVECKARATDEGSA